MRTTEQVIESALEQSQRAKLVIATGDPKLVHQFDNAWRSQNSSFLYIHERMSHTDMRDMFYGISVPSYLSHPNQVSVERDQVVRAWYNDVMADSLTNDSHTIAHIHGVIAFLLVRPTEFKATVINNIELGLTDRGCIKLAELLIKSANREDQKDHPILVTTQSQSLFTGIRVAIKEGHIDWKDVSLSYFETVYDNTFYYDIMIDQDGDCIPWPMSFMDTYEKALIKLL